MTRTRRKVRVVAEAECYRLVCGPAGRWGVVEVRDALVWPLCRDGSSGRPDTADGMAEVLEPDGWCCEADARSTFQALVDGERRLEREIW